MYIRTKLYVMRNTKLLVGLIILIPVWLSAQNTNDTERWDGTQWSSSSYLVNTGTAVGIGITNPAFALDVFGNFQNQNGNHYLGNHANQLGMGLLGTGASYINGSDLYFSGVVDMTPFGLLGNHSMSAYISGTGASVVSRQGMVGGVPTFVAAYDEPSGKSRGLIVDQNAVTLIHNNGGGEVKTFAIDDNHILTSYSAPPAGGNQLSHFMDLEASNMLIGSRLVNTSTLQVLNNNFLSVNEDELQLSSANGTGQNQIVVNNDADGLFLQASDGTDEVLAMLTLADGLKVRGKDDQAGSANFELVNNSGTSLLKVENNGDVIVTGELKAKTTGDYITVSDFNVTDELKIGTNSLHLLAQGPAQLNHIWTSNALVPTDDDNLYIQSNDGVGSQTTMDNSPTTGNTIINANGSKGLVGIGVSDPNGKLDIQALSTEDNIAALKLRNGDNVALPPGFSFTLGRAQIALSNPGGTESHGIYSSHYENHAIRFVLWNPGVDDPLEVGSLNVMSLDTDHGGSVGIGTINPSETLDVQGDVYIEGSGSSIVGFDGPLVGNLANGSLRIGAGLALDENEIFFDGQTGNIGVIDQNDLRFHTDGEIRMEIEGTGAVNIGARTITSGIHTDYQLAVDGKIVTTEIVVTNGPEWADYVFEDGYNLRSLDQVASFIKENKHLPEVPSACEVKANGVNMAEMDVALLKKIEELTLYALEQQAVIKDLKIRLDNLEQK